MKKLSITAVLAGSLLLAGCFPPKPNPEFSDCANACTTKQDACMVNASTAGEVQQCNTRLDACVQQCEQKHSRYLK
ncbi:MAG: hypothetical protein PVG13_08475 [Thiohalophilus sp.]